MKNYAFIVLLALSLSACFTTVNTQNNATRTDPSDSMIDIDANNPDLCFPAKTPC